MMTHNRNWLLISGRNSTQAAKIRYHANKIST
jgi:hypothetical protein